MAREAVSSVPARRLYRAGAALRRTETLMAQIQRASRHGAWWPADRALLRGLIAEAREELHQLDLAVCLPSD